MRTFTLLGLLFLFLFLQKGSVAPSHATRMANQGSLAQIVVSSPSPLQGMRFSGDREEAIKILKLGHAYYQRGIWRPAALCYRRALEIDPGNRLAAERFVESCFHNGQFGEMVTTVSQLEGNSPGLRTVAEAIAASEIEILIRQRDVATAHRIFEEIPWESTRLNELREKLREVTRSELSQSISAPLSPQLRGLADSSEVVTLSAAEGAFRDENYSASLWNLDRAEDQSGLPRDARMLRAWGLYHLGRYHEAGLLFEQLYQTQPDKEAARGIVTTLQTRGDQARLDALVEDWGGLLSEEALAFRDDSTKDQRSPSRTQGQGPGLLGGSAD